MPVVESQLDSEQRLIEAAKSNPTAFGALYDRHFQTVYGFAYRRVSDHQEAEDVTAETFRKALEHIGMYEYRGLPFSVWLCRIAANVVNSRYRKAQRQAGLDEAFDVASDDVPPDALAVQSERGRKLRKLVETLPLDQQRVIVLRFARDEKLKVIAEQMGRSEGAIKQLLHRALGNLRERLGSDYEWG